MFIPVIHKANNIINRDIIYSDTVLSLNEIGSKLNITTVDNILEESLEDCLRTILSNNPDVLFNTIQYSNRNKKLYIYADKKVNLDKWLQKQENIYEPIDKKVYILNEIKNILTNNENTDINCISLFEVAKLIINKKKKLDDIKFKYDNKLERTLGATGDYNVASVVIHDFDYDKKELNIGFNTLLWNSTWNTFKFSKKDGDLYMTKADGLFSSIHADKFFYAVGNILSDLYDIFMNYEKYEKERVYNIKPVNSNLYINISKYGIDIKNSKYLDSDLNLKFSTYEEDFRLNCNSNKVIEVVKDNELKIFKSIFVNIEECPEWMREELYNIRKKQLNHNESKVKKRKLFSFWPINK